MPVSIPETPNISGEISITRVNSTASACNSSARPVASPSPGASSGTMRGASAKASAARTKVARLIRLSALDASRHASSSFVFTSATVCDGAVMSIRSTSSVSKSKIALSRRSNVARSKLVSK